MNASEQRRIRARRTRPVVDMEPTFCPLPGGRFQQRPALAYQASTVPTCSAIFVSEESAALADGTASSESSITFDRAGMVVAVAPIVTRLGAFDSMDAARCGVGALIFTGAQRTILSTDGNSDEYAPVASYVGCDGSRVFLVGMRVQAKDVWRVKWLAQGAANARAKLCLYFRDDFGLNDEEDPTS